MAVEYIVYKHKNSSITTFGDFCDQDGISIAYKYINNESKLLNYKTNKSSIESTLKDGENIDDYSVKDIPFNVNTSIKIPKTMLSLQTLSGESVGVIESTDLDVFIPSQLASISGDSSKNEKGEKSEGVLSQNIPFCTAYMWCRALSPVEQEGDELLGRWIDVSKYVITATTQNGMPNSSSFSIQLDGLVGEYVEGWEKNINEYKGKGDSFYQYFSSQSEITDLGEEKYNRSASYFHNIINTNDLIFLKFSKNEKDNELGDILTSNDITLLKEESTVDSYDFIGLVDSSTVSHNSANASTSVNVAGRDLIKLLSEDGCYFYPEEYAGGAFVNNQDNDKLIKRIFGSLEVLGAFTQRSLQFSIQFILNQLSYTGLVPESTLEGWGDRRNRKYVLGETTNKDDQDEIINTNKNILEISMPKVLNKFYNDSNMRVKTKKGGSDYYNKRAYNTGLIKRTTSTRAIKNSIDDGIKVKVSEYLDVDVVPLGQINQEDYIVTTPAKTFKVESDRFKSDIDKYIKRIESKASSSGSYTQDTISSFELSNLKGKMLYSVEISNIYIDCSNYAKMISTIGEIRAKFKEITDRYYQPILDLAYEYKKNLDILESDNLKNVDTELMDGVYQIFNVNIDKSVADRRIVDSSISIQQGSMLSYFNKLADGVFIEMFGDTYRDEYYLNFRQPPFDKKSYLELASYAVDVEIDDVISSSFQFDTRVYSWYSFRPKGLFFGESDGVSLAFLPAIYFSEFSDVWGSKPMNITSNYVPYLPIKGNQEQGEYNFFLRQAYRDLKYLIDSNCYLPFTRVGTITMKMNRQIKKGIAIRNKATKEIFYVKAVTHTYTSSTTGVTSVMVERGMVEEMMKAPSYSYFDICSTEFDEKFFEQKGLIGEATLDANTPTQEVSTTTVTETGNVVATATTIPNEPTTPEEPNTTIRPVPTRTVEILKDWKVNKGVFNFYMKRRQFSKNPSSLTFLSPVFEPVNDIQNA